MNRVVGELSSKISYGNVVSRDGNSSSCVVYTHASDDVVRRRREEIENRDFTDQIDEIYAMKSSHV